MENLCGYHFIKNATGEVVYTVEHRRSATDSEWRHFRTAVHYAFWRLPTILQPRDAFFNPVASADALFDGESLVFALAPHHLVAVDRHHNGDVLSLQEINTQHVPGDFFCRVMLILLNTFCPSHSLIHSSAGETSWSLPLRWLYRQYGGSDIQFVPPQPVHRPSVLAGAANELLLRMLSTSYQLAVPEDWLLLTALECRLQAD